MAIWSFNTGFESSGGYSAGNLSGQDSWTSGGTATISVSSSVVSEGTQSVECAINGNGTRARNITDVTTDGAKMYVSLRASNVATVDNFILYFYSNNGATNLGGLHLNAQMAADWSWRNSGGTYYDQGNIAANTWYRFGVEFNFTSDQMRFNVDNGSFGSWITMDSAFAEIDKIELSINNGDGGSSIYYVDNINAEYSGSSLTSSNFLTLLGAGA